MPEDIKRSEYVELVRSWVEDYERQKRLEMVKKLLAEQRVRTKARLERQLREQEGMWEEYQEQERRKQLGGGNSWPPAHIDF